MGASLTSIVAGALFALPSLANATTGYVCAVEQYNYAGLGNDGGLLVYLLVDSGHGGNQVAFNMANDCLSGGTSCMEDLEFYGK